MSNKLTQEQFISKAIKVHGNKYDYSKVVYINSKTKVSIRCTTHDIVFAQTPNNHMNGQGCPMCSKESMSNLFRQQIQMFIAECNKKHKNKYDYSKVIYKDRHTNIIITCQMHGDFTQRANSHIRGRGCPTCKKSHSENKIAEWLSSVYITYIREKRFLNCTHKYTLPFDFYLPDYNTCIEYDGEQHFMIKDFWGGDEALQLTKHRDNIKTKYCLDNNITLIRIPYWDRDNIQNILEKALLN